ncbi:MAG: adenylosuccinate lyase [Parcubacteria group bacterium]|nr:adenylosuccinate lyase [Parcubacteria group bacterium]
MKNLWHDLKKKTLWHQVEKSILFARSKHGDIPLTAYKNAEDIIITEEILGRADELEVLGDHDLIAFVLAVSELLDDRTKIYYHTGVTSFDIEDTALALLLVEAIDILIEGIKCLRITIFNRAIEHKKTVMVGRTHFIHAEPITFGLKLLNWVDVLDRHLIRMKTARENVRVGKISGAVGKYSLPPQIEKTACEVLGLKPAKISNQILSRDLLVEYTSCLVGVADSLERFATEIRHLAGTDLGEVAEFKKPADKGSSAMPGKSFLRNPIKSENICSLTKAMRGYLIMAHENENLWGERSLDNSALERIFLPDATTLLDFMLNRFNQIMEKLEVYPKQMNRNLWKTGGIVFAQQIMIALTEKGMARDTAYDLLEALAKSLERDLFVNAQGQTFRALVHADPEIINLLSASEIENCFNPELSLKYVDEIFDRFN